MSAEFSVDDHVQRVVAGWQGMKIGDKGHISGFLRDKRWFFLKEWKGIHCIESFINLSRKKRAKEIIEEPENNIVDDTIFNNDDYWKNTYKVRDYNYNIHIEVSELVTRKLRYYVCSTENEVSGLGSVKVRKVGKKTIYLVEDIFCLKQESSFGGTQLDTQDVAAFHANWIKEGKDFNILKCWWHSHGTGSVFWSKTDDDQCDRFAGNKYMVSLVTNHNHEILGRVDKYKPRRVRHTEIKPYVELEENTKLKKDCEKEVKIKNKETKYEWNGKGKFYTPKRFVQPHRGWW